MREPSDANYNITQVTDLRLGRLTPLRGGLVSNSVYEFSGLEYHTRTELLFDVFRRAAIYGGCWIPLGHFNSVIYSFSPTSSILQLQHKVQDQQLAETASAAYFGVQKHDLAQGRATYLGLPWGGSSASPLQKYAINIARSLSLRSVNSHDSGYSSENAYAVNKSLH